MARRIHRSPPRSSTCQRWVGSEHVCFTQTTVDGQTVVGRYRYQGQKNTLQPKIMSILRSLSPPLCLLPFSWTPLEMKARGLPVTVYHIPEEVREVKKFSGKLFPVTYYRCAETSLTHVPYSIDTYTKCFISLRKAMIHAAKKKLYYLDIHKGNVLFMSKINVIFCDVESCLLEGDSLPDDFILRKPTPPELLSFLEGKGEEGGNKKIKIDLFAVSIWYLGCMFVELLSRGKTYSNITEDSNSSSSVKDEEDDPLRFLLPDVKVMENTNKTQSLQEFMDEFGHLEIGQAIEMCLRTNVTERRKCFLTMFSSLK